MASKSKRRRKVLGASCILAALIIAGSSFAWFTSKDEVTNRLSSNADYGVSIVESFAPPKNWTPGQEINKDVYAINTGTVAAFVNEDITSKLTYTVERLKTQAQFDADKCLTLTADEVDKVKAGAYLAGAFTTAGAEIGTTTGGIAEYFDNGAGTDPKTTDDFTPTVAGLYFFRRSIAVDPTSHSETFKYDGYYFDGTKYYELRDIRPNEAQNYKAGDVDVADGTLTTLPTYKYVVEETNTVTPTLKYDSTNKRLVASYNTNVGATNGSAVDNANSTVTAVGGKLDLLQQAKTALDTQQATYEGYVGTKNAKITEIGFYAGPTKAATIDKASANITILTAADDYSSIAQYTPSNNADIVAPGVLREQIDEYNALVGTASTPNTYLWYDGQIADAEDNINNATTGKQKLYNDADDYVNNATTGTQHIFDEAAAAYQTATGHSYTDDIALIGTPASGTDLYTVWQKDQANKEAKAALATAEQVLADAKADKDQLEAAAAAVKAKLIALSNTINTNQIALDAAIDARNTAAGNATTNDPATHGEKAAYESALTNYNNALKAYNEARATYEANDTTDCDIKVYINLSNDVVTTSSGKDKWLLKPIDVTGKTAHFYYTGILESAESSSKLIDSVELAPEVSQKAYKYFDFDLNVSLDSAQIVYDDDQKTILTTAVTGNAAAFENQNATLASPQNLDTEVLWN